MAPSADPATWVHESSIIKEDELREIAEFLGKGFRIHHPDAVGGIRLSRNPDPQKYMVMHYHSVGNGFRLPLHVFEKVEAKIDRWARRYFVIEFPAHSPLDLPSIVRHSSLSRTPFATAAEAERAYNALREEGGLISHHSLQDASRNSSRNQAQGDATALAICKPAAALDVVPISAIPGLRKPTPSQKRPQEGVTDNDFLPKKSRGDGTPASPSPLTASSGTHNATHVAASGGLELPNPDSLDHEANKSPDQAPLQRPTERPQSSVENTSPPIAAASQGLKKEVGGRRNRKLPQRWGKRLEDSRNRRNSVPPQYPRPSISPSGANSRHKPILSSRKAGQISLVAQQSLLTLTEEYLGGAWGNYRAMVVLKDKELAAKAIQQKVDSLGQQVQALQEENARLKADASAELMDERSRVKSLQEQIATYQGSTHDLETQFDKLWAQISSLESKVSTLEGKEGSLKAELVERESRISELENSLQGAKQEGAHFSELMLKHMGLKRVALEKLKKERKTTNEFRSKVGELEKTMASHQEEVAALTARAKALYEEGKFDMQFCIYKAIRSGLPDHRSLDDFISYYDLPLPLPPPDSRANPGP
ncbi:unnamed protein product [Cuscuta campestris]|uniref:Uncharacterized protein n=1 Tax=Cuscuta campestris TaxID=132261 RepID=A0A484LTV6_9ASTE|nr:unnamed protein product [Cuscuta campestris]